MTRRDLFSFDGATRLAKRIQNYWKSLGHSIEAYAEPMLGASKDEPVLWVVRSNLLNALPRTE